MSGTKRTKKTELIKCYDILMITREVDLWFFDYQIFRSGSVISDVVLIRSDCPKPEIQFFRNITSKTGGK